MIIGEEILMNALVGRQEGGAGAIILHRDLVILQRLLAIPAILRILRGRILLPMGTVKITIEIDMGVGDMQVAVIPATRSRMIITAAVDETATITERVVDGTIKDKMDEMGSGTIRIGTIMQSQNTIIDGRHLHHLCKTMIDSHVHLLDMTSGKIILIKINIRNTEAAAVAVVVLLVFLAMFHLHHPTSLAISYLG